MSAEPSPSSSRIRSRCALVVATIAALAVSGCGGDDGAISAPPADPDEPAVAESVKRTAAPSKRSSDLAAKLNLLREQTFRDVLANPANAGLSVRVAHRNELYTAAVRHAINLNTTNSAFVGATGTGNDAQFITVDSPLEAFFSEVTWRTVTEGGEGGGGSVSIGAGGRPYPALYTNTVLWDRILAVRGGPDFLRSRSESIVDEFYVFSGNLMGSTGVSRYRGYNEDNITNPPDAVDNVWYTSRGRVALMRASLRGFGYGRKDDTYEGYKITPPFPILSNRFVGVLTTVMNAPLVSLRGHWPSDGNLDVIPYGLDTDIGGASGYAGPPIHFTVPLAEPILTGFGNLSIEISKVGPLPLTQIPGQRQVRIFSNQIGLSADVPAPTSPGAQFKFTGSSGTARLIDRGRIVRINQDAVVPNGYSTLEFASDVTLDDIRPGDQVLLEYPDNPATDDVNEDAILSKIYTVLANSDRPDLGELTDADLYPNADLPYPVTPFNVESLPVHALAVSYVGGHSQAWYNNGFFDEDAEYYPSQAPEVFNTIRVTQYYPYDWFERPDRESPRATVNSTNISRASVEARPDLGLRQGEFIIVPTEPLEPNATYRVRITARTVTESNSFDFTFTTNGRTAPR